VPRGPCAEERRLSMNWPFRSLRIVPPASPSFALPPSCEGIEPLLPLYADGMASPDEMRQVEAHLPGCAGCRESLFWMQATHRALAARPVAVPPADLHSRIAEAIAASSAAPSLRPAHSFTLRPAYAAAASLTVLGVILGHSLLHSPVPSVSTVNVVKPAPTISSVPPVTLRAKNVLPRASRVKPHHVLVARNAPAATTKPDAAKSVTVRHAPAPMPVNAVAPPDRVVDNAPAPTHASEKLPVPSKPVVHLQAALPKNLMASAKVPRAETRHPATPEPRITKPNVEVAMLPRHEKEPFSAQVHIGPAIVTMPPPATVKTASFTAASGGLLAGVKAYAIAMSTVAPGKTSLMERQISRGGTNAMQALDHDEHFAYEDAIHLPSSP